jgi:hypothetical protein
MAGFQVTTNGRFWVTAEEKLITAVFQPPMNYEDLFLAARQFLI